MIKRFLAITCLAVGFAGSALAQEASTHTVRPGETLYRIATTNGMSVDELKRLNGLEGNVIHVGQVLRLSPASAAEAETSPAADSDAGADVSEPRDAEVDAGAPPGGARDVDAGARQPDDAEADAGVSPLRERDFDAADTTAPDDTAPPADAAAPDDAAALAGRGITTHIARPGETLYSIAADRGTKAYILFTLNNGVRAPLEAGTPLVVPAAVARATYAVRRGDTLSKIARAQGTTVAALRRVNALESDALEVGQTLTIPGAAAGDVPMQGGTRTYAVGSVTVFPDTYAGRVMAGGAAYAPDDFVVAHRELPFDTVLIVENAETGRASFARVADRGPVDDRRMVEISSALSAEIGVSSGGRVRIRLVE